MPKGLQTRNVPIWVAKAIEATFREWEQMSGEWLQTAPEYHLTVKVAQRLTKTIPAAHRTLLMEPKVSEVLKDAGGVQRGPKAKQLRHGGRFDIVLGHGNGQPRVVIELKNPLYVPMARSVKADLHRICRALLHGKHHTQLYSGLLAFYTSSAPPKRRDRTAAERLHRKWVSQWRPKLQDWSWAGAQCKHYSKHLRINVGARIHERVLRGQLHAWAAVVVQVKRKPRGKKPAPKIRKS